MDGLKHFTPFNAGSAVKKSRLLPVRLGLNSYPLTCGNCSFINSPRYNFCTNCGFPVHPTQDRLALYNYRLSKRKSVQKNCQVKIVQARNALYILGACCMLGVFYLFSDRKVSIMKGIIMVCLGLIYAGLGKWSVQKPFTSLLIALITIVTFLAINTWAEFSFVFTTPGGIYTLLVQVILTYFLLQGVKSAFHVEILEEEFKL